MKQTIITLTVLLFNLIFLQAQEGNWQYLNEKKQKGCDIKLIKSSDEEIVVQFKQNAIGLDRKSTRLNSSH